MVHADLYLKSIGFGLAVAAPVGPMALLCMRRTLTQGWRHGLATGAGIAVGDGVYAAVAALGLAGLSHFILSNERPLHAAAGLYLIYLGLKTLLVRPDLPTTLPAQSAARAGTAAFSSAVLLTLTNPPTIIMFAAIFTALAPSAGFDLSTALLTVAGVCTGSLLWWGGVTWIVSSFRHALGPKPRRWIDRLAGAALALFGLADLRCALER
jgi:threonine/homoserine/homoserine lactone efflux protein